ncbi:MAG: segregation and condensation protein A [Hyphomicrobiaceae bacterium]
MQSGYRGSDRGSDAQVSTEHDTASSTAAAAETDDPVRATSGPVPNPDRTATAPLMLPLGSAADGDADGWDAPVRDATAFTGPIAELVVDVDGFEGPLDLLLALARIQKVDLSRISVLALAEQYLAFVAAAGRLRLEMSADYLVMAAWLTYLKSRLLLPNEQSEEDEPTGEELAQRLAFRLMRLDAMRTAASQLMTRKRLGRDVFQRGLSERPKTVKDVIVTANLFDLLKAYAVRRVRRLPRVHVVKKRHFWSIKDARQSLERFVGRVDGKWQSFEDYLKSYPGTPAERRTALASSFGASLEMAREGLVDLRQEQLFGPLLVRGREQRDSNKQVRAEEQ